MLSRRKSQNLLTDPLGHVRQREKSKKEKLNGLMYVLKKKDWEIIPAFIIQI